MALVEQRTQPLHGNLVGYAEAGADSGRSRRRPRARHRVACRAVGPRHGPARRHAPRHRARPARPRPVRQAPRRLLPRRPGRGMRDLLASLGHDRVTLVGHSLGGGIAMQFAYQFPERVERSPWSRRRPRPRSRCSCAPRPCRRRVVLPLLAGSWVRSAGGGVDGRLGRAGARCRPACSRRSRGFGSLGDRATREAFVHTARSVIDIGGQRSTPATGSTSPPTCRCWSSGARDSIIPVEHGRALAAACRAPGSRCSSRSGHFPHMTEPERLAGVLADWVAHDRGGRARPRRRSPRGCARPGPACRRSAALAARRGLPAAALRPAQGCRRRTAPFSPPWPPPAYRRRTAQPRVGGAVDRELGAPGRRHDGVGWPG